MWYHFAFVAISVTMFGMTIGAVLVYLLPKYFNEDRIFYRLGQSSFFFALTTVITFFAQLNIPFSSGSNNVLVLNAALIYFLVSIPFCWSGICITLALSKFPVQVSKLYASDLGGAALGCISVVLLLKIMDGPTAVVLAAAASALAAFCFTSGRNFPHLEKGSLLLFTLLTSYTMINTYCIQEQRPLFRLPYVKGNRELQPRYEKWNCSSRVTVIGDPNLPIKPLAWGLSASYKADRKIPQMWLSMDGNLQTVLTKFSGNFADVDFLKYDVTNLAYYLKPQGKVAIIGAGGGRDILSALTFGAQSVSAIEINDIIIDTLNKTFGDFTGHLNKYPQVTFVNREARSYLAALPTKFDLIQLAIIDTQVASAAGAYGLSENSLYTVEAWKIFLNHLNENGLLTCTRWCFTAMPGETYRLVALARKALTELGVSNTQDHIVVIKHGLPNDSKWSTATVLVSRAPFTSADLEKLKKLTTDLQFEVIQSPLISADSTLGAIASGKGLIELEKNFPIRIDAPTDDNPFFFYMVRTKDLFIAPLKTLGVPRTHTHAERILAPLLIAVFVLTLITIFVPFYLSGRKSELTRNTPFFAFFAAIGLGFMLIEVSQMERFIIFLGNPTYSLSVVLFTLLLSSALGSLASEKLDVTSKWPPAALAVLVAMLTIFGFVTPYAVSHLESAAVPLRVLTAASILFPPGFFMGMAFPSGIKIAAIRCPALTPWLWAINGAASVCASVLAIFIAINANISSSFWMGTACYIVALLSLFQMARISEETPKDVDKNSTVVLTPQETGGS